jgi:hypothetical protein
VGGREGGSDTPRPVLDTPRQRGDDRGLFGASPYAWGTPQSQQTDAKAWAQRPLDGLIETFIPYEGEGRKNGLFADCPQETDEGMWRMDVAGGVMPGAGGYRPLGDDTDAVGSGKTLLACGAVVTL